MQKGWVAVGGVQVALKKPKGAELCWEMQGNIVSSLVHGDVRTARKGRGWGSRAGSETRPGTPHLSDLDK